MGLEDAFGGSDKDTPSIIENARGDSVKEKYLLKRKAGRLQENLPEGAVVDYLDEDEQPHYLFVGGNTGLTIERNGEDEQKFYSLAYNSFCVITDKKIHFVIGREGDNKHITLPYSEIQHFEWTSSFMYYKSTFYTDNTRYHFKQDKTISTEELNAAKEYIKEMANIPADSRPESGPNSVSNRVEELVAGATGAGITADRLTAYDEIVLNALDEDEQPHYLIRGAGYRGIQIQKGDEVETTGIKGAGITGALTHKSDSHNITVLTDKRVLALMPLRSGVDEYSIPYDIISNVNIDRGFSKRNIQIATTGQTYYLEVRADEEQYMEDAVRFIRNKRNEAKSQGSVQTNSASSEESALEKLERLSKLKENGVLSEEEFEAKKAELMDKI